MKKMKLNLLKFSAFILLFSFTIGCGDYLEEDFRDGLSPQTFYNSEAEARMAVNGVYAAMKNSSWNSSRWRAAPWNFGTDELSASRNIWKELHNYTFNEGIYDGQRIWDAIYSLIRNANSAIEGIEGNEKLSQSFRDQSIGELLTLRAFGYYDLTVQFGDVPYFRTLLSSDDLSTLPRTPMVTIRTDMKEDLEKAFTLLPSSYPSSDLGRMTKWAAMALKSKYHLMDKEWADCLAACKNIIDNSPHKLMEKFEDVYGYSSTTPSTQVKPEHIMWVDYSGASGLNQGTMQANNGMTNEFNPRLRDEPKNKKQKNALKSALAANNHAFTGFGAQVPLPDLAKRSTWEDGDLRYDATILTHYEGIELKFPYFKKLQNLDQTYSMRNGHPENVVFIRLADIYLMAAESENELNGPTNAYQYVNKVRERAFEPDKPWSGKSQASFRTSMYDERKWELCAEQHRRVDLIRWGILEQTVKNTTYRKWNNGPANIQPKHVKYPIPLNEILRNPKLLESDPSNNGYR
mgnify:FL=1|tara:strand:- start:2177 stop:3730 length:1554 start_codon:yes stop_codon:yes gene_type:complete